MDIKYLKPVIILYFLCSISGCGFICLEPDNNDAGEITIIRSGETTDKNKGVDSNI